MQRARSDVATPHVVTELLDARNRELFRDTIAADIIVTPEIVSMQLTQIARNPILSSIYRELLSAGGVEICLRPARRYTALGQQTSFRQLVSAAQKFSETAIGVSVARAGDAGLTLNPHKDESWAFGHHDRIIVMAQEVYD